MTAGNTTDQHAACPLADHCQVERDHIGDGSPGPVESDERLLRALIEPQHFNRRGKVKAAFIKEGDFQIGQVSVWRRALLAEAVGEDLAAHFRAIGPQNGTLVDVLGPSARAIRSAQLNGQRAFCILDDTVAGPGHDAYRHAHASIRLCDALENYLRSEPLRTLARETLRDVFLAAA